MSLQFPSSLELFNTSVLESFHTNVSTTANFFILGITFFFVRGLRRCHVAGTFLCRDFEFHGDKLIVHLFSLKLFGYHLQRSSTWS